MDALALLCNLYGDGPSTLRRLRAAGCLSVEHLERKSPGDLSELLHIGPEQAGRLIREARQISLRFGTLEQEEGAETEASESSSLLSRVAARATGATDSAPAAAAEDHFTEYEGDDRDVPDEGFGSASPAHPKELMERVLHVWRERDQAGPDRGEESGAFPHEDDERDDEDEDEEREPAEPEATRSRPIGSSLRPHVIDGLDLDTCLALRRAGIETLEDLVQVDEGLELSREIDLALTRILRLQFLARRKLGAAAERGELVPTPPPEALGSRSAAPGNAPDASATARSEPSAALTRSPETRRGPRPISELLTDPLAEAVEALAPAPARLQKFSYSEEPFSLAPVGDPQLCRQLELLEHKRTGVLSSVGLEGAAPGPRPHSRPTAGSAGRPARDDEAAGSAGPFA